MLTPRYPFWARTARAWLMVVDCSVVRLGRSASSEGSMNTRYWSTVTPSTVPVPMKSAPVISC